MKKRRFLCAAGMPVLCWMGLLLSGCSSTTVDLESSTAKLDAVIAKSYSQPVLVDFWKFGCASCMSLEPVIGKLADDYKGRVVVGRFLADQFWFEPTNWEVFKRYGFAFFPTVILFVDGKEKHRWVWNLDVTAYRKELDPLVAGSASPSRRGSTSAPASAAGKGR